MRRARNIQRERGVPGRGKREGYGWRIKLTRRGRQYRAFVWDSEHGGALGALERAVRLRDEMEANLPPPIKAKLRHSRCRSGVIGVCLETQRLPSGRVLQYYSATWQDLSGRAVRKRFLVSRFGRREAKRLAVEARRAGIAGLLAMKGARPKWAGP